MTKKKKEAEIDVEEIGMNDARLIKFQMVNVLDQINHLLGEAGKDNLVGMQH